MKIIRKLLILISVSFMGIFSIKQRNENLKKYQETECSTWFKQKCMSEKIKSRLKQILEEYQENLDKSKCLYYSIESFGNLEKPKHKFNQKDIVPMLEIVKKCSFYTHMAQSEGFYNLEKKFNTFTKNALTEATEAIEDALKRKDNEIAYLKSILEKIDPTLLDKI